MSREKRAHFPASLAAVYSAVISAIITTAGTLISLNNGASKDVLFLALLLFLILGCAAAIMLTFGIVIAELRADASELRNLRSMELYVPQLIRFRQRTDTFMIKRSGDASLRIECEVTCAADSSVPWITFPMLAEVPDNRPPWSSVVVNTVNVNGIPSDPSVAYVPRDRRFPTDDPYMDGRVTEAGVIRVPVSLDSEHRSCRFYVELELLGAFSQITKEEMCYTDVTYVTENLAVNILGEAGFELASSPFCEHRVEAMQLGMEMKDPIESVRQSDKCRTSDRVIWQTDNGKLGYRYRIPVRGTSASVIPKKRRGNAALQ